MEKWFRTALLATAAMNILGAPVFLPASRPVRELFGFPDSHPVYLWVFAAWVFGFGLCYLWMAVKQRRERLFIAVGAIGKLTFFAVLLIYAMLGEISFRAPLGAVGDLVFGVLFVVWLTTDSETAKA